MRRRDEGGETREGWAIAAGGPVAARAGVAARRLLPVSASRWADLVLGAESRLVRLADAARADLDGGVALPGLVVVFALGIALYFSLPREPWWPAVLAAALAGVAITVWRRRAGHAARVAATVTALVLGVAAAAIETVRVAAPRLDRERTVAVEGRVVDLDATARGGLRLGVEVVRMEGRGLGAATIPARITATLADRRWWPDIGDGVRFTARLKPPEGPVLPGGYDFARRAWFDGRGAGGYVLGRAEPGDLGPAPLVARLLAPIGSLRHGIATRVRAGLPGPTGTIAAALMVGEQRAIPESVAEPLRASGLTHIVSISGLHMSLVAGGVIVAARGLLALFPLLALGFSIKKWAAAIAMVAATVYLLLSGNQVAALRSHLMLSVALLAVMVDRPAITMHTVAVSAALILAVDPSQALEPSFLMSYLAVIGLVASYDLWRSRAAQRPPPAREAGLVAHLAAAGLRHVEGLAFSSLVAGLATAPVIAGVFFRGAPYSILANMLVLPVTGLVIMPAAVVAALAMPFGLDPLPLAVMGLGIDWMIAVGRWTAALPAGAGLIGLPHPAMMPCGIAAVLWLSAWKSRIRLLGLVPAAAAVLLVFAGPRPDVVVGRHGSPVAVRGEGGRLDFLVRKQDRFDTAIWLAADDDGRSPDDPGLAAGWTCDTLGCTHALSVAAPLPLAAAADRSKTGAATIEAATNDDADAGGRKTAGEGEDPKRGSDLPTEPAFGRSGSVGGAATASGGASAGAPAGGVAQVPVERPGSRPPRGAESAGGLGFAPDARGGGSEAATGSGDDRAGERPLVAVVRHPRAFAEDCRRAALVITPLEAPPACRDHARVIDRIDLARLGAITLTLAGRDPSPGADPSRSTSASTASRTAAEVPPGRPTAATPTVLPDTTADGGEDGPEPATDGFAGNDPPRAEWTPLTAPLAFRITHALPVPPRPWTPVDPDFAEEDQ